MNHSTAIFLINNDVRAIAVTYEKIDLAKDTTKMMKYQAAYLSGGRLPDGAVVFKTMDTAIKVDDFVIVPTDTRHGMTVCKVVEATFLARLVLLARSFAAYPKITNSALWRN